ncbi:MAG: MerR family DNA-binding protein, partial [Pseudomonadales bacterium]
RGRQLGVTLDASAEVIRLYAPGTPNHEQLHWLLEKITEKRAQLLSQREALDAMLGDLDRWQTNFEAALNAPSALNQWRQKA